MRPCYTRLLSMPAQAPSPIWTRRVRIVVRIDRLDVHTGRGGKQNKGRPSELFGPCGTILSVRISPSASRAAFELPLHTPGARESAPSPIPPSPPRGPAHLPALWPLGFVLEHNGSHSAACGIPPAAPLGAGCGRVAALHHHPHSRARKSNLDYSLKELLPLAALHLQPP